MSIVVFGVRISCGFFEKFGQISEVALWLFIGTVECIIGYEHWDLGSMHQICSMVSLFTAI